MGARTPGSAQGSSRGTRSTTHGVEDLIGDLDRAWDREELVRRLGEVVGRLGRHPANGELCGQRRIVQRLLQHGTSEWRSERAHLSCGTW